MYVFEEYGAENKDVIILLHGGGLGTWNYHETADLLKDKFHIIIPALDGHSGSKEPFSTIEESAKKLIALIDERFNGKVFLIGGLSLGGQILVEMLSQRKDICLFAIVESTLALPMPFTTKLIKPTFSLCFPLVKKRWFARLQFYSLHIKPLYFERYYQDTSKIKKEDMIAFLEANSAYQISDRLSECEAKTLILVGSKERSTMKKSAYLLSKKIKKSSMEILKGYYHGDLSLNHPKLYAEKLLLLAGEKETENRNTVTLRSSSAISGDLTAQAAKKRRSLQNRRTAACEYRKKKVY